MIIDEQFESESHISYIFRCIWIHARHLVTIWWFQERNKCFILPWWKLVFTGWRGDVKRTILLKTTLIPVHQTIIKPNTTQSHRRFTESILLHVLGFMGPIKYCKSAMGWQNFICTTEKPFWKAICMQDEWLLDSWAQACYQQMTCCLIHLINQGPQWAGSRISMATAILQAMSSMQITHHWVTWLRRQSASRGWCIP